MGVTSGSTNTGVLSKAGPFPFSFTPGFITEERGGIVGVIYVEVAVIRSGIWAGVVVRKNDVRHGQWPQFFEFTEEKIHKREGEAFRCEFGGGVEADPVLATVSKGCFFEMGAPLSVGSDSKQDLLRAGEAVVEMEVTGSFSASAVAEESNVKLSEGLTKALECVVRVVQCRLWGGRQDGWCVFVV